jgi:hypothetical protein
MHPSKKNSNKEEEKTIIHHSPPSSSSGDYLDVGTRAADPAQALSRHRNKYGMAGSLGGFFFTRIRGLIGMWVIQQTQCYKKF